jgi:hypothetical protein
MAHAKFDAWKTRLRVYTVVALIRRFGRRAPNLK